MLAYNGAMDFDVSYSPVTYQCLMQESIKQRIHPALLYAVRKAENGKVGQAVSNKNGTRDLGPMQLNEINLKEIAKHAIALEGGVDAVSEQLKNNGCFNISAGAWFLRKKINEAGGDVWKGVGLYHSNTPHLAAKYINRVYDQYRKILSNPAYKGWLY